MSLALAAAGDTIVAPATPRTASAVALVRLSGPGATAIGATLCGGALSPGRPQLRWIVPGGREGGGQPIDRGLVTFFPAPRSYTGEDVVEISCHGSPAVVRGVLAAAEREGARPARRGEFTERAYRNGKMDLLQAEAVATLSSAVTERQARAALQQLSGSTSTRLETLRESFLALAAELEAGIDFGTEGIEVERSEIAARLQAVQAEIARLLSGYSAARRLYEGVEVAILGPTNSGKSSLFNKLLNEERALVSPEPGTTRDFIQQDLEIDGVAVVLVDTAGLRDRAGAVEAAGIARSKERAARAAVVLWVVDLADPESLRAAAPQLDDGITLLRVRNKLDLAGSAPAAAAGEIDISVLSGEGLERLRRVLGETLRSVVATSEEGCGIWLERHRHGLERAASEVAEAIALWSTGTPEEVTLVPVYAAATAVAGLTGGISSEEVLTRIFSSFCIGK